MEAHWQFREVDCPICSSARRRHMGWRGGEAHVRRLGEKTRIVRCRDCGLAYPFPTPFPLDHSHYSDPEAYFGAKDPAEQRIEGFRNIIAESARYGASAPLLDVGCGRGESLVAARELGWEARGLEPSAEFARAGQADFGVEIEVGRLDDQFEPDTFGLVILAGVLEHVYDPAELLERIRRVLKPGGLVFIDVPNERSLMHRLARAAFLVSGHDWTLSLAPTFEPFHVNGFNGGSLAFALRHAELEPVRIRGYAMHWIGGRAGWAVERATERFKLSAGLLAWGAKPAA